MFGFPDPICRARRVSIRVVHDPVESTHLSVWTDVSPFVARHVPSFARQPPFDNNRSDDKHKRKHRARNPRC